MQTPSGRKTMEELDAGDMVLSANGQYEPVLMFAERGVDINATYVRVRYMHTGSMHSLLLSPWHRLAVKAHGHIHYPMAEGNGSHALMRIFATDFIVCMLFMFVGRFYKCICFVCSCVGTLDCVSAFMCVSVCIVFVCVGICECARTFLMSVYAFKYLLHSCMWEGVWICTHACFSIMVNYL